MKKIEKQLLIATIIIVCLFMWVLRDKTDYGVPEYNSANEMIDDGWAY